MQLATRNFSRYLLTLFIVGASLSLLSLAISQAWAKGFGMGALVSLLPQCYFALQAFGVIAAQNPQKAYLAIMRGQSGKFLLTAALFALLFKFQPDISAPAVFTGFVVMLMVQTFAGAFFIKARSPNLENLDEYPTE